MDGQSSPLAERRDRPRGRTAEPGGQGAGAGGGATWDAGAQDLPRRSAHGHRGDARLSVPQGTQGPRRRTAERPGADRTAASSARSWPRSGRSRTRSSTSDGALALQDAHEGGGAILAIAAGGARSARAVRRTAAPQRGPRANRPARGIVSTVLRDVYLADTVDEAVASGNATQGQSSFVTPDGMLIGPAVDPHRAPRLMPPPRHPGRSCRCSRTTCRRRSSSSVRAATARRDRREIAFLREQHRRGGRRHHLRGRASDLRWSATSEVCGPEEELLLTIRIARGPRIRLKRRGGRAVCRRSRPRRTEDMPELPPLQAAVADAGPSVAVETLRSATQRAPATTGCAELRAERDALAAQDPHAIRQALARRPEASRSEGVRSAARAGPGGRARGGQRDA